MVGFLSPLMAPLIFIYFVIKETFVFMLYTNILSNVPSLASSSFRRVPFKHKVALAFRLHAFGYLGTEGIFLPPFIKFDI